MRRYPIETGPKHWTVWDSFLFKSGSDPTAWMRGWLYYYYYKLYRPQTVRKLWDVNVICNWVPSLNCIECSNFFVNKSDSLLKCGIWEVRSRSAQWEILAFSGIWTFSVAFRGFCYHTLFRAWWIRSTQSYSVNWGSLLILYPTHS